jgi:hypothetical protein
MGCDIYLWPRMAHEMYVRDSYSDPNICHFGLSWTQDILPRIGPRPQKIYKGRLVTLPKRDQHPYWMSPKQVRWFRDQLASATHKVKPKECWESGALDAMIASVVNSGAEVTVIEDPVDQAWCEAWRKDLLALLDKAIERHAYVYISI